MSMKYLKKSRQVSSAFCLSTVCSRTVFVACKLIYENLCNVDMSRACIRS
ncbi:hypothetical protein Plhal703r1_c22g0094931 [Plasmopara halstedii]